jgi:predicted DNA-binding transcriptional regulator YafY
VEVTVVFSREVAWWAARQLGATTARIEHDGAIVAKVPVANRDAFVGWVLSFGEGAMVVSPPDIRQAVIDRVKGLA